jgi:hypothetical protein
MNDAASPKTPSKAVMGSNASVLSPMPVPLNIPSQANVSRFPIVIRQRLITAHRQAGHRAVLKRRPMSATAVRSGVRARHRGH